MGIFFAVIAMLLAFGVFGSWVARQKRREPIEGMILGVLFGPVGVIVEAVLPTGDRRPATKPRPIGTDRIDPELFPDRDVGGAGGSRNLRP